MATMHLHDASGQRQPNSQSTLRAIERPLALNKEIEDSRALLSQILSKIDIPKFYKLSTQQSDQLKWYYGVIYEGIDISIFPAEPNKDCIPVKKTNTYTSWVCEKREKTE